MTLKRSSDLKKWQRAAAQSYTPQPPVPLQPVAAAPLPYGVRKVKSLKESIEEYLHEKTSGGKMDTKTQNTMRSMLSLVGEVFGPERCLYEIERHMIVKVLQSLPAVSLKPLPWSALPVSETR